MSMRFEYLYNVSAERQDGSIAHFDYLKIPILPSNELDTYIIIQSLWQELKKSSFTYRSVFGFTVTGNCIHVTRRSATLTRHYELDCNGKVNL